MVPKYSAKLVWLANWGFSPPNKVHPNLGAVKNAAASGFQMESRLAGAERRREAKEIGGKEPRTRRLRCLFSEMTVAQKTGIPKWVALVSGKMDQNLRNPSWLILSHTQMGLSCGRCWYKSWPVHGREHLLLFVAVLESMIMRDSLQVKKRETYCLCVHIPLAKHFEQAHFPSCWASYFYV